MVRLLHTADVHLTPDAPERTAALEAVLALADAEGVDCLTVGGDLFDSDRAADDLRDDLRDLFSGRDYPVLTIPGNHDAAAFGDDLFFGADFEAAVREPFGHHAVGDCRITALPYTPEATDDLLLALADRDPVDGPEALLLHCSLEAPVEATVGDEGETRYFPIDRHRLADLGFDYYLAGHYHSAHDLCLPDDSWFVYPGSPASVTRSETGRRGAVLVDTEAGTVDRRPLDTFHYDRLDLTVTPGEEADAIEAVTHQVETWADRRVAAEIAVDGFVGWSEREFHEALVEASGDVSLDDRTKTVARLESHPLYEAVEAELADREVPSVVDGEDGEGSDDDGGYDSEAFEEDVRQALLTAFSAVESEGRLS